MEPVAQLLEPVARQLGPQQLVAFALVLARLAPLFLLAPLFSNRQFPPRARGICAVALAVGITPLAAAGGPVPLDPWAIGGLVLKEMLVGAAFAFAVGMLLAAVAVAGTYLDTMIGFAFGGMVDPMTGNQSSLLSQIYALVGVAIFIAIGGDAWVIQGIARTYDLVPLADAPALGALVAGVQEAFVALFVASLEVCAPILLALVITDVAFGVVSRVVPQLNVFAVGFPAKVAVGLVLLGVSLPFAATWLADELERSVGHALQSLRVG